MFKNFHVWENATEMNPKHSQMGIISRIGVPKCPNLWDKS
jgi:hypothetical protein